MNWPGVIAAAALACHPPENGVSSAPPRAPAYSLDVRNHSPFEVVIYAVPSTGPMRIRLANVAAFLRTPVKLPRDALRSDGTLVLELHAIGSHMSWTTPEVSVYPGVTACLDIHSDLRGYLGRSTLYTRLAPDTTADTAAARDTTGGTPCPRPAALSIP